MEGAISNFRRGRTRTTMNQMIVVLPGISSKEEAAQFIGKELLLTSPAGKELKGKIHATHGNSGAVRAIFATGMPGQSIGTKVLVQ